MESIKNSTATRIALAADLLGESSIAEPLKLQLIFAL